MTPEEFELDRRRLARHSVTPVHASVGAFVHHAAGLHGDKIAFSFFEDDEHVSYRQFDELSNRLAHALAGLGVRHGSHVAVMLPNRMEYPVTWVALAKLGAVMVPVNTRYTPDELTYALIDSDSEFLVIDAEHVPMLDLLHDRPAALGNDRVVIRGPAMLPGSHSWGDLVARGAAGLPDMSRVTPDTVLGLQYTSGTTGMPKGCVVSHDYWMLLGRTICAQMMEPLGKILSPGQFHYMTSRNMLLSAMQNGGTLYMPRRPSSSRFVDWLQRYGIEWCFFPQIVLQEGAFTSTKTNLRHVGIATYTSEQHLELESRFGIPARELFGMTEVGAAIGVPVEASSMSGSGSIGIPMLGREAMLMDDDGNPVPRGTIGELCIAGPSMLQAYYKKPDANAKSFVGKWFRTGDLARQDADGCFYIVGRVKDMIRRSGENIAARELETVALRMPEIEDAAAVGVPDPKRGEEVKLFLSLRAGRQAPPAEAIMGHFQQHVASFKVPRYLAWLDEFPRSTSLKIQKSKLKEPPYSELPVFDRLAE